MAFYLSLAFASKVSILCYWIRLAQSHIDYFLINLFQAHKSDIDTDENDNAFENIWYWSSV